MLYSRQPIKGILSMEYYIPKEYVFNKDIECLLRNLISTYKYKHYTDLAFSDKCSLAALLNTIDDKRHQGHDCICESSNLDQILATLRRLLRREKEASENFLEVLLENIVAYYDNNMRKLFNHYSREVPSYV